MQAGNKEKRTFLIPTPHSNIQVYLNGRLLLCFVQRWRAKTYDDEKNIVSLSRANLIAELSACMQKQLLVCCTRKSRKMWELYSFLIEDNNHDFSVLGKRDFKSRVGILQCTINRFDVKSEDNDIFHITYTYKLLICTWQVNLNF